MLFNSLDFTLFFPIVFFLYWFVFNRNINQQNLLVLVASYIFYGWWDWRFLTLILFSTVIDYSVGLGILSSKSHRKKKALLWTSIGVNLGLLGFFKYFNFFIDNFAAAFSIFGIPISDASLNIILPVGISFYTFQTMSYSIDVYRGTMKPTRDFIAFSAYVSFFPQLVAGPIERASKLLPQFRQARKFDPQAASDGLKQILWGLFKKVVIADKCAEVVNLVFSDPTGFDSASLILAAIFFSFQIYGDFSGYSDIAIGIARIMGFNLMRNFAYPYFSRDIAEFWRRWHISLSTWFRDYLYIPLGGSRVNTLLKIRNTFIIFVVSGFWHGANWTFIFWGLLNAIFFLPLLLQKQNRKNLDIPGNGQFLPKPKELFAILGTFGLTTFAWIFFRAESLPHAIEYIRLIPSDLSSIFSISPYQTHVKIIASLLFLVLIEWIGRHHDHPLSQLGNKWPRPARFVFYYAIIFAILRFGGTQQEFIYFQF